MRPSLTFRYSKHRKPSWIDFFFKHHINYITLQFSRKRQIQLIKQEPYNIIFIIFPTKEMQFKVVKKHPNYIYLINFQYKEVKEFVINFDPNLIERINFPTYEMKIKAIQYDPYNLLYIDKFDYNLCEEAIRQFPKLFSNYEKLIKRRLNRKDYRKVKELHGFLVL